MDAGVPGGERLSMARERAPISTICIALGQHVRAGIEDNLWGPMKGQRFTTVEMVRKMVSIASELGRPIATAEETKRILKLGEWYDTAEETLFKLGLPPNPQDGERGFLTYDTDGRIPALAETPSDPRYVL
ncbi:MAG: 3-keto-5-aminohexanoate cleavage protein [Actinobacteria bacterium]|nr:3-keto-5-aminohexanoate cleavage protein [Actinomycetota bacterium]